MKRFVFYHEATGTLHKQTLQASVVDLATCLKNNTPDGHVAIEHDEAHPNTHRFDIERQEMVEQRIAQPGPDFEWSEDRKDWVLKKEARAARAAVRAEVARLLDEQRQVTASYLLGRTGVQDLHRVEAELKAAQAELAPQGLQGTGPSG